MTFRDMKTALAHIEELRELRNSDALVMNDQLATIRELKAKLAAAEKEKVETYIQFGDLKTRLLSAERANEFMRGYLARVTEDDTVREELVVTGDPTAPTLVPKRKPVIFPRSDDFTYPRGSDEGGAVTGRWSNYATEERKPRHWVNY